MKRNSTLFYGQDFTGSGEQTGENRKISKRVSPGERVIRNILNYSKSLTICQTRYTGTLNLVMN